MDRLDRYTSVILAADIVGYTSMMQQHEKDALARLHHFESVIKSITTQYRGEIVKTSGDGCLVLFNSAVNATAAAIEIQKQLRDDPAVPLRIGIHIGELVRKHNDVFGDGVNIASRIESIGIENSVLISPIVKEQLRNQPEFELKSLGNFSFKNVQVPIELFALANQGLEVPQPSQMKGKGELAKHYLFANKKILLVAGIVALLLLVGIINKIARENPEASGEPGIIKLAVLPLNNLNDDKELDYFSDGVTQEIIDELAKISSLQVSAFSSTRLYKETSKNLKDVATELSVSLILSGSSRVQDDSVRLNFELIDPQSNARLWSNNFDDLLTNSISIQNDLARRVAGELNIQLSPTEERSLSELRTKDYRAFDYYLRAKDEINQTFTGKKGLSGILNGVGYLEKSIELDPNYAQAYTHLAWIHFLLGQGNKKSPFDSSPAKIMSLLNTSKRLDPSNSDNYLISGGMKQWWFNDLEGAKNDVDLAIEMNSWPIIPTNYCMCTAVLVYMGLGEYQKAMEIIQLTREIDPLSPFTDTDEAIILFLQGKQELAVRKFDEAVNNRFNNYATYWAGWANYQSEKYLETIDLMESVAVDTLISYQHHAKAILSNAYLETGQSEQSEYYKNLLINLQAGGVKDLNIPLAKIAMARGDEQLSMYYLNKAYDERDWGFAVFLSVDKIFDPLRKTEAFTELLHRPPFEVSDFDKNTLTS